MIINYNDVCIRCMYIYPFRRRRMIFHIKWNICKCLLSWRWGEMLLNPAVASTLLWVELIKRRISNYPFPCLDKRIFEWNMSNIQHSKWEFPFKFICDVYLIGLKLTSDPQILSFNKLHFLIIDWASECRERPQIEWQIRIITINLIYSLNLCVNIIIKPQNMQIQLITLIHHH